MKNYKPSDIAPRDEIYTDNRFTFTLDEKRRQIKELFTGLNQWRI